MSEIKISVETWNKFKALEQENNKLIEALECIKWSIKSCRAGDGDTRTWEQCCLDCETVAEEVLNGKDA